MIFVTEKMQYFVEDFENDYGEELSLQLIVGEKGLTKEIRLPEVHRPGLAITGFLKRFSHDRILVFGNSEALYLEEQSKETQLLRLGEILTEVTPVVIYAAKTDPSSVLLNLCKEKNIPFFRTELPAMDFISRASYHLAIVFAPSTTCHGTFIEAFGVGVLIQGDSSIGKSEAALGLMDRGHRLISDDVVKLRLRKDSMIEGFGPQLNKHMMEIRGIGIINVAHLYGAVCVRGSKTLDVIVKLEEWDDDAFYDRIGLDEKFTEMLGINIPYHILPVKPGRDVVLLIETIVLNHRLKMMGYHSAKEFNVKLLETISRKKAPHRDEVKP